MRLKPFQFELLNSPLHNVTTHTCLIRNKSLSCSCQIGIHNPKYESAVCTGSRRDLCKSAHPYTHPIYHLDTTYLKTNLLDHLLTSKLIRQIFNFKICGSSKNVTQSIDGTSRHLARVVDFHNDSNIESSIGIHTDKVSNPEVVIQPYALDEALLKGLELDLTNANDIKLKG